MHYVARREGLEQRQEDGGRERHKDRQPDQYLPIRRVVDVITGGSVGHVKGKKRQGSLDSILMVSEQPTKREL